jgi:6-methylsalicylate decarboxylase
MALKIDVHHHIFAPFFMNTKLKTSKEVGWRTPPENLPWSLSKSLAMMDSLGIGAAILSYPAGIPEKISAHPEVGGMSEDEIEKQRQRGRDTVREMNRYAMELCHSEEGQGRFGWFACLPDLRDVEGVYVFFFRDHCAEVSPLEGPGIPRQLTAHASSIRRLSV